MKIVDFKPEHIPQAAALALACYEEERCHVSSLPAISAVPDLSAYADNGLGVSALDGGRLTGFLCSTAPFERAFGSTPVRGVFSPMGCSAALPHDRAKIYAAMYQAAAEKWVRAGAVSHAVCLYTHDHDLQRQFYRYGFGLRCMDAIRPMEPICAPECGGYQFSELAKADFPSVYPLAQALHRHAQGSPYFLRRRMATQEEFSRRCAAGGARYFVASRQGLLCAYAEISACGETFITTQADYRHMNGAYCLPEHRGRGLYPALIDFVISVLKKEGFARLGVDFESYNPTAYGFWPKHFAVYTHGVVRRIDESVLEEF